MSLKVFRTIFKFALIINLVISLYMAVYLATDHLFNIQGKSLHRSNMIPQFNKLRNLTYKANGSDLEERLRVNLISKRKVWLREQLQSALKCNDRSFKRKILQRGDFWVFKNYIQASHGPMHCFESVTYTTHGSYRFLRNLFTLVQRWDAPVSIAVYAPGRDFTASIGCIRYLRDCHPESHFIRYFVTFHLYFPSQYIPSSIPENIDKVIENPIECGDYILCDDSPPEAEYKLKKNLLYPVNVGRNIARDAALTHFILASDVELFPNPGLVNQFLEMIVAQGITAQKENHEVYAMPVFEIESFVALPNNKSQLQLLFEKGHAIVFHQKHCKECQSVTMVSEWIEEDQTPQLKIFLTAKRKDKLFHWEPIFIGTNDDPYYEERLSWEGLGEKMVQAHILCLQNYSFHILNNAFLVHKPGIRRHLDLKYGPGVNNNNYVAYNILPEIFKVYGRQAGCQMFHNANTSRGESLNQRKLSQKAIKLMTSVAVFYVRWIKYLTIF